MNTVITMMTDAYEHQSFFKELNTKDPIEILDFRNLDGTRCYLDDIAKEFILNKIRPYGPSGIHFIDSGNYHYLSLLWMSLIKDDFSLILFDHHPDNQPPSFGDITSCGGWVLEAQNSLTHLKNVYTYGVGTEVPIDSISNDYPIFISIDKDVLSPEFSVTDWDQGDMTLDELLTSLNILCTNHKVIGVDICGDSGEYATEAYALNSQTNLKLFDILSTNA